MKKVFFVLTLTVFAVVAFAQPTEVWNETYDSGLIDFAGGIAVDGVSNVYVTGYMFEMESEEPDYLTVKYDRNGNFQWEKTYDGDGGDDYAKDVAADEDGNVYVTGSSESGVYTIKYDTDGNVLWDKLYGTEDDDEGQAIAVDVSGNVYVAATTYPGSVGDFLILKYDSQGNLLWDTTYSEPEHEDWYEDAHDVAVDGDGNVYVVGYSYDQIHTQRILILKYDKDGIFEYKRFYGEEYERCSGDGIAVDNEGNIYVAGSEDTEQDYFVLLKYGSDGELVWDSIFERDSWPGYTKLAVDNEGYLYTIGRTYADMNSDLWMVKYDGDGNVQWEITYGGSDHDFEGGIAVDASGYIYISGSTGSIVDMAFDYLVVKYTQGSAVTEQPPTNSPLTLEVVENLSATPTLSYTLPAGMTGTLTFYSVDGRKLESYSLNSAQTSFSWISDNASGVYFVKLSVGNYAQTVKAILMR